MCSILCKNRRIVGWGCALGLRVVGCGLESFISNLTLFVSSMCDSWDIFTLRSLGEEQRQLCSRMSMWGLGCEISAPLPLIWTYFWAPYMICMILYICCHPRGITSNLCMEMSTVGLYVNPLNIFFVRVLSMSKVFCLVAICMLQGYGWEMHSIVVGNERWGFGVVKFQIY